MVFLPCLRALIFFPSDPLFPLFQVRVQSDTMFHYHDADFGDDLASTVP